VRESIARVTNFLHLKERSFGEKVQHLRNIRKSQKKMTSLRIRIPTIAEKGEKSGPTRGVTLKNTPGKRKKS